MSNDSKSNTLIAEADGPRWRYDEPAFPSGKIDVGSCWTDFPYLGMSLRDYFAAQAMAAYVAKEGPASDEDGDFVAKYAYEIADAMLAERVKSKAGAR